MNNQLNPDPQGRESNMTTKQLVLERFPKATCEFLPDTMLAIWPNDGSDIKGCLGVGNDELEAWESAYRNAVVVPKPEGATTQPTPVSEIDPKWTCSAMKPNYFGGDPVDCNWPHCGCDPHVDRIISGLEECGYEITPPKPLAQPVPSAGSKPQEVGECEWNGRILSKFHEFVNMHGGGKRCIKCKKEFTASIEESQPVADGGGLQALDITEQLAGRLWRAAKEAESHTYTLDYLAAASPENILKLLAAHASSQEALREMTANYNTLLDEVVRLNGLSPEGSSR
jgi:hypothetical protein